MGAFNNNDFLSTNSALTGLQREFFNSSWLYRIHVAFLAVSVTTIVANLLSILAVVFSRGMSANLRLICSLLSSDLLCGISGIIDSLSLFGTCEEAVSKYLLVSAHMTALLTLLLLAFDHYLAICKPLYHRSDMNISVVNIMIVVIWIVSLFCSTLEFFLPVNSFRLFTHYTVS